MNNIPKGFKLVPVEPTEDILTALIDTWFAASPIDDQEAMAQAYKAMLAVAPTPRLLLVPAGTGTTDLLR